MADRESDDTPLRRDHVDAFIVWYRTLVRFPRYLGVEEHWWNALRTLNLGELRNGMRILKGLSKPEYMDPPKFWHRCKSIRAPETAKRWREIRELLQTQEKDDADSKAVGRSTARNRR